MYPIYIVSKGRYENPLTARLFKRYDINFKIVIEPHEYNNYISTIDEKNILVLPFSNLGKGSFPARNWVWGHSISEYRSKRHWVFDDNIRNFVRLNNGERININPVEAIKSLEYFTDRYKNIAISGFNYRYFVTKKTNKPFVFNTHVYSAILVLNELPFRWRLKYNEDVDLCLQALTKKWCTVLFNAYLIEKISTSAKMKGGNQDELYKGNDPKLKLLKVKSLETIWPDYVKVVVRFNRPHHYVNWKQFNNVPKKVNNTEKIRRTKRTP